MTFSWIPALFSDSRVSPWESKIDLGSKVLLRFFLACVVILVAGCCTTPYQSMGFRGGYSDVQLDRNTIKITFQGNAATRKDTVENYLLYRCAETTIEHGFDYFVIIEKDSDVKHGAITTQGKYSSTTKVHSLGTGLGIAETRGTYTPGTTIYHQKYGSTALIKLFKGKKPDNLTNAYNAKELMRYVMPHIERSSCL